MVGEETNAKYDEISLKINRLHTQMRKQRIQASLIAFAMRQDLSIKERKLKERLEASLAKQIRINQEIDDLLDEIFETVEIPPEAHRKSQE